MKIVLAFFLGMVVATAISVLAQTMPSNTLSGTQYIFSRPITLNVGDRLVIAINPGSFTLGGGTGIINHTQSGSTFTGDLHISGTAP